MNLTFKALSVVSSVVLGGTLYLAWTTPATAQVLQAVIEPAVNDAIPYSFAPNSITNKIYVGYASGPGNCPFYQICNVVVIDGATNVSSLVPNTTDASAVVVNPVTNTIYTGVYYGAVAPPHGSPGPYGAVLQVIDGSTDTLTTTISLDPTATVLQLFVDSSSNTIYAAGEDANGGELFVIDGATNALKSTMPIPTQVLPVTTIYYNPGNETLAIDLTHGKLYGIDGTTSTLYVVDLATKTASTIAGSSADSLPIGLAIDPALNKIYVLNSKNSVSATGTIAVFDGASAMLETTRPVGTSPSVMGINPVTQLVFVADAGGAITVLDEHDLYPYTVTSTIGAITPAHMAIDTVANKIYLDNRDGQNYMIVLNGDNFQAAAISGFENYQGGGGTDNHNDSIMAVNTATHAVYSSVGVTCTFCVDIAVVDGTGGSTAFATVYPDGSRGSLNFTGSIGAPSAPQTIYIANTGSKPMTITNLQFGGAYYPSILQSNSCTNPILPGTTCPISLVYAPDANTPTTDFGNYNISVQSPAVSVTIPIQTTLIP